MRVLFVDDEANLLSGLRRALARKRNTWDLHFANGVDAALELLEQDAPFDVVITDMSMPQMSGAELLGLVAERTPGAVRIVLSGRADRESTLAAANVAHQFIAKPCDRETIELVLTRVHAMRERATGDLINAITQLGALPVLPDLYDKLIAALDQPEPSIERVAAVISGDIAMSAKLLQLVNSAYFAMPRQVASIKEAATLIGLDVLKDLAMSGTVFQAFDRKVDGELLSQVFVEAYVVSKLMDFITQHLQLDKTISGELRLAGAIHDVGRLAMIAGAPDQPYHELAEHQGEALLAAERDLFGIDHATAGAYLLGVWGLPESIVQSVFYHHHPIG
ncbi:MAG: response regulator [Pseudomonadota bacterium]